MDEEARETGIRRHIFAILLSLVAAAASGAIFLASLYYQYALVEIAASLATGLHVFFLSAAIADMVERKKEANRARNFRVVAITLFLAAFYSFTRYVR